MPQTLQTLTKKLQQSPDTIYYRWYGTIFSEQDVFTRLDKTYLYVVKDNIIQRVIGYSSKTEDQEPILKYSTETCYRIMSGNRKGRVLPSSRIFQNETCEIAGIKKDLEEGTSKNQINEDKPSDSYLLEILGELEVPPHTIPKMVHPQFYLSCPSNNKILYPRKGEATLEAIKATGAYNESLPLETCLRRCLPDFAEDAGKGRSAYPFEHIYGKGIVVADPSIYGTWFAVDKKDVANTKTVEFTFT